MIVELENAIWCYKKNYNKLIRTSACYYKKNINSQHHQSNLAESKCTFWLKFGGQKNNNIQSNNYIHTVCAVNLLIFQNDFKSYTAKCNTETLLSLVYYICNILYIHVYKQTILTENNYTVNTQTRLNDTVRSLTVV